MLKSTVSHRKTQLLQLLQGVYIRVPLDEEHPQRELRLGFDSSMRMLEIVILLWDDGTETIIHSMKARKQYRTRLD